ncbi:putative mandelate racemase [Stappia sp. 22II-S9-Z10]|nr:putative mandelate racemase [Stappia sp. 22II-S9-Z10]
MLPTFRSTPFARDTTVRSVTVRAVSVPLRRPVIADIGRFDEWPLVLVDVETDDAIGNAYVAPYRGRSVPALVATIRDLGEDVTGAPLAPVDFAARAAKALNVAGTAGVTIDAIAALDMALWDARAKAAGVPLAVLLGGSVGPVRAYNSNGLWRHKAATLGAEARDLLAEGGFDTLKLRLGNARLADDLAAIDAVRNAVGEIDLMVDFNQALGLGDAVRRCHALDDLGLYWFEEPIAYDNLAGYALLAAKLRTPLQLGENFYGPRDLATVVAGGGIAYAMGDLMRIGGVTGWLRTAAVAGAAGVQFSNHLYPEIAAHLLRVTPSSHWLEWVDWALPILADPALPADGHLTAPERPGIGLVWDEAAITRFAVRV